jgi:hypothetical protein
MNNNNNNNNNNNQVDTILFSEMEMEMELQNNNNNNNDNENENKTTQEIIFNATELIKTSNELIDLATTILQRWNIFVSDEKSCIREQSSSLCYSIPSIQDDANDHSMFWNSISCEYPLMKHIRFDYYKKTVFECNGLEYQQQQQPILCIIHENINPFLSTIGTRMIPIHCVSLQHILKRNMDIMLDKTIQSYISDSKNHQECFYIQTSNALSVCQSVKKHKFFYIHENKIHSVLVFKMNSSSSNPIVSSSIAYERKKQIVAQLLFYYYKNVTKMNFILPQVAYNTCRRIFQEHKRFHIQSVLKRIAHENKSMCQWEMADTISTLPISLAEYAIIFHLNK